MIATNDFIKKINLKQASGFLSATAKNAYVTAMISPHVILHSAVHIYDFQILITLYTLCRNLFTREITRKVACDLLISSAGRCSDDDLGQTFPFLLNVINLQCSKS